MILSFFSILSCNGNNEKSNIENKNIYITNPKEVYKKLFHHYPDTSNVQVLDAQYWESSHWTLEYKAFLKMKIKDKWWNNFFNNNLQKDTTYTQLQLTETPEWFTPSNNYKRYKSKTKSIQNSVVYYDSISKICYIYDSEL